MNKGMKRLALAGLASLLFVQPTWAGVMEDQAKEDQTACDKGDAASCFNLGLSYANGEGVKQDQVKAAQLYDKSCGRGVVEGCFNLGRYYERGEGVKQDQTKANQLYDKACSMGFAPGCFNLAINYGEGRGVKQDMRKAAQYFDKSCSMGDADGCKYAKKLSASHGEKTPINPTEFSTIPEYYRAKVHDSILAAYVWANMSITEEEKKMGGINALALVMSKIVKKIDGVKTKSSGVHGNIERADIVATHLRDEMSKNPALNDLIRKAAQGKLSKGMDERTGVLATMLGEVYKVYFENYRPE